jgi:hypothetical protein
MFPTQNDIIMYQLTDKLWRYSPPNHDSDDTQ